MVEDDDMLRKALKMEFQGSFRTLAAADAAAALFLADNADDLVAVVSDFELGDGANGVELLAQVRSQRPKMARVLVTAGSSANTAIGTALSGGTVLAVVEKPWKLGELCKLVESLIDR